jgi:L-seryl-tRNA(Ser) seleniumtransferase
LEVQAALDRSCRCAQVNRDGDDLNYAENPFRALPQVQKLLETREAATLAQRHGTGALTDALRAALASARERIGEGGPAADAGELLARAAALLDERAAPGLCPVINATGIVIHTNLGRAPLAGEAIAAVGEVARGYCNLEFDLIEGSRGSRTAAIEPLLAEVTGAQAGLPVNNGAAAILLALSALAQGGEVIVSRGELVEIGGGFRIPEVIRQGGARLVEVGSTNRTRVADYAAAIGSETRVLLKVHQSNFRTIGFTEETSIAELAGLAKQHGLRVVADLGSGLVARVPGTAEPTLAEALGAGADLVTCSGDKLLGGPQAGLVLGRRDAVDPLRKHPLLRALRLDKMSLAALEATLRLHRDAPGRVPVLAMLAQDEATLAARAEALRASVGQGEVVATDAFAGGGALPEERVASRALALVPAIGCDAAAAALRAGGPAVVGRIAGGRLLLDMLTVTDAELPALGEALRAIL